MTIFSSLKMYLLRKAFLPDIFKEKRKSVKYIFYFNFALNCVLSAWSFIFLPSQQRPMTFDYKRFKFIMNARQFYLVCFYQLMLYLLILPDLALHQGSLACELVDKFQHHISSHAWKYTIQVVSKTSYHIYKYTIITNVTCLI